MVTEYLASLEEFILAWCVASRVAGSAASDRAGAGALTVVKSGALVVFAEPRIKIRTEVLDLILQKNKKIVE